MFTSGFATGDVVQHVPKTQSNLFTYLCAFSFVISSFLFVVFFSLVCSVYFLCCILIYLRVFLIAVGFAFVATPMTIFFFFFFKVVISLRYFCDIVYVCHISLLFHSLILNSLLIFWCRLRINMK